MKKDRKSKGLDDGSVVRIPEKTNSSSDAVCEKTQGTNPKMEQDIEVKEEQKQGEEEEIPAGMPLQGVGQRIRERVREDYARTFESIESQNNFDLSRSAPKDSRSQGNPHKNNEYTYRSILLIPNPTPISSSNSLLNNPASSKLIYQQNYQQQEQSKKEKRSQYCQLMEKYLIVPCQSGFTGHYYADTLRKQGQNTSGNSSLFVKQIENELKALKSKLLQWLDDEDTTSAFIFFDIDNIQLMQLMMVGSRRSPFSFGIFCFDVLLPTDYPKSPPRMHLNSQLSQANLKIAPYVEFDGRVCLDILGTQKGRESEDSRRKWQPHSSCLESVIEIMGQVVFGEDVMRNARFEQGDINSEIFSNNNMSECNSSSDIAARSEHDWVYQIAYSNATKYVTLSNSMEFILNMAVNEQIKQVESFNFIKDHFVYNEVNIKQMVAQWIAQEEDNKQLPLYAGIVEQNYQEIAFLLQQNGFVRLAKEKIQSILALIVKIKG